MDRNRSVESPELAALSGILRIIATSQGNIAPVLTTVSENAARLCEARDAILFLRDGDWLNVRAHHGPLARDYQKLPVSRNNVIGRAVIDRATVHVHDLANEIAEYPLGYQVARRNGFRTILGMPLLWESEAIGALTIRRQEVRPFTPRQIELVETFANQAVIAIENARLFEEVHTRERELEESLKYQTATSEVLGVISRSTFDLQPVLDAVVESATRLCGATRGHMYRFDGEILKMAAAYGAWPGFKEYLERHPLRPGPGSVAGRAAAERRTTHVADVLCEPGYARLDLVKQQGYRTVLAVPMHREEELLGVINILKTDVEPFTSKQIELVETFANQAVIAIENARLFEEVQARTAALSRSVAELEALGEVGRAVSSSLELDTVLLAILNHACQLSDTGGGAIYTYDKDKEQFQPAADHGTSPEFAAALKAHPISIGETLAGSCVARREAMQIEDLTKVARHPLYDAHLKAGVHALLAVPLLHQEEVLGVLSVRRMRPGAFAPETVRLLKALGAQSSIAISNARLFQEIEEKGCQLEDKNRMLETLSSQLAKYLSPQIYGTIFSGAQSVEVASKRKKLTVFFSDIAGFTETADRLESEELTQLINHYLTEMSQIALEYGGTIDKYVGDGIVIFFGDPESRGVKQDALACVKMAIAMRDRMNELHRTWRDAGIVKPLQCRIGINTGFCTVGNFGSEDRMDYTIIGSGVNLASRLENSAKPGKILVSYETYALVKDEIFCEKLGEIAVKGISHPVETYQVVGPREALGVIREISPNFNLQIDIEEMSSDERKSTLTALTNAMDRLATSEIKHARSDG